MTRVLLLGGLFVALAGCPSEPAPPATAMPGMTAMPAMTAAPMAATTAPDPTPEELPVPEDFEEEASAAVQEQNFRAELDRIAREIEATP